MGSLPEATAPANGAPRVRAHLRRRLGVAAVAGGAALLVAGAPVRGPEGGESEAHALAAALEAEGLVVDRDGVMTWGPEGPLRARSVLFRAEAAEGGPADLFYADARFASAGASVLGVRDLTNLTRSSGADEGAPVALGPHRVAFLTRVGEAVTGLVVLDLRGEPDSITAGWSARERLQNYVTNWQETGRAAGFGRTRFTFDPPAEVATLAARAEGGLTLRLVSAGEATVVPIGADGSAAHPRLVREPREKGRPGRLTWVVDTVRDLSFVGPEPIAWLENRVFALKDLALRSWYRLAGSPPADEGAEVAEELGLDPADPEPPPGPVPEVEVGWPPRPLAAEGAGAPGEGAWTALGPAFVGRTPGAPAPFVSTYLKVDPERPYARVYLVAWDPRQVQLRIMTGTREPESATGATGPGRIPRDPETMRRVVASFNGGFQSLHGEFGMMSEGKVYLPPKPWAATVAVRDDGRVAMGSWLPPPRGRRFYLEGWAVRQIPSDVYEFRQNLTSVVEDGVFNPWERWYWGAAPRDADDQTFIDRSGLCLTEEGFLVYFWGESMGADQLGEAMIRARCVRGLHLDMNQRHTGFELYRTYREEDPPPPLGRALRQDMEFDVKIPRSRGWRARGRKLVRAMTPMRFPRYLLRDVRDFFYLTLKPVLPGPPLPEAEPRDDAAATPGRSGVFRGVALPELGWPPPWARTEVGEADAAAAVLRIDPRRALPAPLAPPALAGGRVLGRFGRGGEADSAGEAGLALYAERAELGWRYGVGPPPAGALALLRGPALAATPDARAAIGVDADGFWVVAERRPGAPLLGPLLRAAGVETAIALPERSLALLEARGPVGTFGTAAPIPETGLTLLADPRPAAEVLFPDVEPAPYAVWGTLQDTRVRYFRASEGRRRPRFQAPDGTADSVP